MQAREGELRKKSEENTESRMSNKGHEQGGNRKEENFGAAAGVCYGAQVSLGRSGAGRERS